MQPPAGGGHAESPESKRRFKALLDVSGLSSHLHISGAPAATLDDIHRVHDRNYIAEFKRLSDAGGGELGAYAPFGRGSFEIAALSAGLAKQALADVLSGKLRNAYALSRPPGHHCLPDKGMGFCLMANIPIAIEAAKAANQVNRVAVVDWDVHHGNGTQAYFYDRDDVLTISLHQETCFPPGSGWVHERGTGAGEGHNINIPLPSGSGHEVYLYAMQRVVEPVLRQYQPDVIIIASGLDANGVDPLARMLLHSDSYREMTGLLMAIADEVCGGKLVAVHEGGYAEACVPFCGLAIMETLADERTAVVDPFVELISAQQPTKPLIEFHKKMVDEIATAHKLA